VSSAAFCGDCGTRSNPSRVKCLQCGGKLPHSHVGQNPALYAKVTRELPRAAVFDLDMTLFDNTQRFKDARRAGLVDKDGKAVSKGMMSDGQAWRKRNNFLYSKKNLRKDKIMPGAKQLLDSLLREGYTIVYLTGRPKTHYEATIEQLEYFGFPLFRDNKGETLLIMKERLNAQVGAYKGNALRELSGNYKVEMFFDDDDRALAEALKLQIPGVYSTVEQRTNPGKIRKIAKGAAGGAATALILGQMGPQVATPEEVLTVPAGALLGGVMAALDDDDEYSAGKNAVNEFRNPIEIDKRSGRPYSTLEDPEEAYDELVEYIDEEENPTKAKTNPANPTKVKKAEKLYKHMNGQEPDKVQTEMIDIGDVWYKVGEGGAWQIGYMSGKETGQESQKYIHTFNEETKDGNFPELYATMPEKGKPMLIIRGGTWKIRTDDKGVAWIYD